MIREEKLINRDPDVSDVDEGWWESILGDEEMNISLNEQPKITIKKSQNTRKKPIDWDYVTLIYETDTVITLAVTGFNRGGLLVACEKFLGFVPTSHIANIPGFSGDGDRKNVLSGYKGKTIQLKIIDYDRTRERIVLSERAAVAGDGCRIQVFSDLVVGSIVTGVVTNITVFGVFVDLGGYEGLIHVSELSWSRVNHPSNIVSVGENIKMLVLNICEETSRVALSLKRLHPNPWETVLNYFHPGDIVPAKITSVMRYGAFARLENGVEGLIHNSCYSGNNHGHSIELLIEGQQVNVQILHIDVEKRRMGLALVFAQ